MDATKRNQRQLTYSEFKRLKEIKWQYCVAWKKFNEIINQNNKV